MNLYSFRELVNSTRLGGLQAPTAMQREIECVAPDFPGSVV